MKWVRGVLLAVAVAAVQGRSTAFAQEYRDFGGELPKFDACECPSVEFFCSDSTKQSICSGDAAACARPSTCSMYLTESTCTLLGFETRRYQLDELKTKLRCAFPDFEKMVEAKAGFGPGTEIERAANRVREQVETCATVNHEAMHVCGNRQLEQQYGQRMSACAEMMGNMTERVVEQAAIKHYCDAPELRNDREKRKILCGVLCVGAYDTAVKGTWTECTCRASDSVGFLGEWLSPGECCDCYHRCDSGAMSHGRDWLPPYCQEIAFSSEKVKRFVLPLQHQQCLDFVHEGGAYSCPTFAKNREIQPRSCE